MIFEGLLSGEDTRLMLRGAQSRQLSYKTHLWNNPSIGHYSLPVISDFQ